MFYAPFRPHSLFGKKISVPEFLRSARSSFLLFPIKKENRQRLYNLLSIFILKLIVHRKKYPPARRGVASK